MCLQFISQLSFEQIVEVQRNTHELWGEGKSLGARLEKLKKLLAYDNGSMLSMCGLINDNREIVSSMKQYSLTLTCNNKLLSTIGMGAIYTLEKHRSKGYAQQLIEIVLNNAKKSSYKIALLFSEIDPAFYKKFGFIEYPAIASNKINYSNNCLQYASDKKLLEFFRIYSESALDNTSKPTPMVLNLDTDNPKYNTVYFSSFDQF